MSIKKLLLIFTGLCLVVLIGLICAMRSATFDGFIKQKIISAAAPVVRLSIGDFILSGASIEATKLEGFVPKLFLSFAIDRLKLQSSIFSIITGSPIGQASLEAYNGKLAVEVSEVGATRTVIKKLSGSNFDLSSHSQLSSLGIDAGQHPDRL